MFGTLHPWTPRQYQVVTSNTPADAIVDVFTGPNPTPSSLAWLAGVRHGGNVTFPSWPLLTYYVRVEGVDNHTGPIRVRADFTEAVQESASPSPLPSPSPRPLPVAAAGTGLMDRLPAMISATSTVLAGVLVVANMALQVRLGVSESVVGIPGVGLDYGGVGGGVLGVDIGLFQVCDSRWLLHSFCVCV